MAMTKGEGPSVRWVLGVGIEFAIVVGGLGYVGYLVDGRYDCGPWGVLIGASVGLIGGTYNLIRECLAAFKRSEGRQGEHRSPPP